MAGSQGRFPAWYAGNVPWLLAGRAARSFSQALLVIVVPLYVAAAGYSTLKVGYLLSIAFAGSTAMTLLVGVFSDRYGRKPLLLAIAASAAVGSAGFALTTQFWLLGALAALASVRGGGAGSGGGFGPFYPAEQALIADSCADRDRNTVFSVLSLVGVLTAAIGSAFAVIPGLLRVHLQASAIDSYHPLFWVAALASVATFIVTLPIRKKKPTPIAKAEEDRPRLSTLMLIGRLWLTNSVNGLVIGVMGPFLTYWFALRYGVASTEIATLYTAANLLSAAFYLAAPRLANRFGAVSTIVWTRLIGALLMAGMAVAPTFLLAAVAYVVRIPVNALGMPLRQSFVMGVAGERSRSKVAAFGALPSQVTGTVAPAVASHLIESVSEMAPIWMAAAAVAANAALFGLFFKSVRPPEEQ